MNVRCNDPKGKAFHSYGGRGIAVCDRWVEGREGAFERFLLDMGISPSNQHSIERIDVNGHYEPGNCRWASKHEQVRNLRKNRWFTGFGKTQIMADWAREYGMHSSVLRYRLDRRGMTLEEAVSTPVMPFPYNGRGTSRIAR